MKKAMKITQWVLGISAALSLVIGVINRFILFFSGYCIPSVSSITFLRFTATCALASIALSLIELCKSMEKQ